MPHNEVTDQKLSAETVALKLTLLSQTLRWCEITGLNLAWQDWAKARIKTLEGLR